MAIYLDDQTRPYLERLIKKAVEHSEKDFVAGRLQKMLEGDRERLQGITECKHKYAEYLGFKECCSKCGAFGIGMGEEWSFSNTLTKKEIEDLANSVKTKDEGKSMPSLFDIES